MKIEILSERRYKLLSDVKVETDDYIIIVKDGFSFDGASIPKIFWSWIGSPLSGRYLTAALVHDALYSSESLKRKECDKIFIELMKQAKVNIFKRNIMYQAVRTAGGSVWKKHTTASVNKAKEHINIIRK